MRTVDQYIEAFDQDPQGGERAATGFQELDQITGGFMSGQVWMVAAAPGQGRTTLLVQWAVGLARQGVPTRLICPREPERFLTAKMLACAGRIPLGTLGEVGNVSTDHVERAKAALRDVPLHLAAEGEQSFLNYDDADDPLPPPGAILIDDADLIGGIFPERVTSFAQAGALVILTMPRHLLIHGAPDAEFLNPEWARIPDVVIDLRQAQWPDTRWHRRPSEADLHIIRHRWGPERTVSVLLHGHYSRFVDLK